MFIARMRIALLIVLISTVNSFRQTRCSKEAFDCDNGRTCIPMRWLCDGQLDCRDASDELEENCALKPDRNCSSDEFSCGNRKCLPISWKCDGEEDCDDGSDELNCSGACSDTEFRCTDGQCILKLWTCDGTADCKDGSDETDCPPESSAGLSNPELSERTSKTSYFYCSSDDHRLPMSYVCDGDVDCLDGSDEKNCKVAVTTTKTPLCLPSEYQCHGKNYCILKQWVCDGTADCPTGDDERNCPNKTCSPVQFTCTSGECIPKHELCNGYPDCRDKSDEGSQCNVKAVKVSQNKQSCNGTSFLCNTGECIPKEQLCDGKVHCNSGEDESEAKCGVNECETSNGGCDHKCVNTKDSYYCQCDKGYRLVGKYTCEEIDECKEVPGICSQICTNTRGSYHCSCLPGYLRELRNFTRCKASGPDAYLVFSHIYDIRGLRLRDKALTSVVSGTNGPDALDFHYSDNEIFWADRKEKKIFRADMSKATERKVVVDDQEVSVDGLAIDWIHNNIYYVDAKSFVIKLASWSHDYTKTIVSVGIGQPRSIAVLPMNGYVFWSDWGEDPKIERAALDGSRRESIVQSPNVAWPNGITIDHTTNRLYWCDGKLNSISSSNLDGSHIQVVLYSPHVLRLPYSISVFEDKVYWSDWSQHILYSADKFTGGDVQDISAGFLTESPRVVHVMHKLRQPGGKNVCKNSKCSYFCFRSIEGEQICGCPDGLILDSDKASCVSKDGKRQIPVKTTMKPDVDQVPSSGENTTVSNKNQDPPVFRKQSSSYNSRPSVEPPIARKSQPLVQVAATDGISTQNVGLIAGIVVGIIFGTVLVITALMIYLRTSRPKIKRMRFHNPVYRKTTEDDCDGRGFTIAQEQLFYNPTREYAPPNPTLTLTEADDAPLTSHDNSGV